MRFRTVPCILATGLSLAQTPPAAQANAGGSPRYVEPDPIDFENHAGWQSMFDGTSLKGWDGPTDVWRVDHGMIVAESTEQNPTGPTYMIWQGGEPKNFEIKAEMKLEGTGSNSGIQFRGTKLEAAPTSRYSQWDVRGYQADFDFLNANTGALIECCAGFRRGVPPRPDRAFRGQIVRAALGPGLKSSLLSTFADPEELTKYIKVGDWNQLHLIARGKTMMYSINGHLMSVLLDDNPSMAVDHGFVALQLEGRGNIRVYFRDLWIMNLP
jgi:hypothetical protein